MPLVRTLALLGAGMHWRSVIRRRSLPLLAGAAGYAFRLRSSRHGGKIAEPPHGLPSRPARLCATLACLRREMTHGPHKTLRRSRRNDDATALVRDADGGS